MNEIPNIPPQTMPIEEERPSILMLKTKEEAIAAGIPEAEFDPELHLYREETIRFTTPVEVTETFPQEKEDGGAE